MTLSKNLILRVFIFLYLGAFIYQAFFHNSYEILFMDERIIIDDIYNQWLLFDRYDRFYMIEDGLLKNILIFMIEFSYGGDLRYGRIWSNVYSLMIGPFILLGDNILITATRILNITLFIGLCIVTKFLVDKKNYLLVLLFVISIPGSHYLLSIPKPDILALVLSLLALLSYKKKDFNKTFILFGLAYGTKISALFIFIPFLFVYFIKDLQGLKTLFKNFLFFMTGFFISNPILIIPPISSSFPNFQKLYLSWITGQAKWGQVEYFDTQYSNGWLSFISDYLKINRVFLFILFLIVLILSLKTLVTSYSSEQYIEFIICLSGLINLIYILFFVKRNFPSYLFQPIYLLIISCIIVLRELNVFKYLTIFVILFVISTGSIYNFQKINSTINELPNGEKINDIENVLEHISDEYTEKNNFKYKVAWSPVGYIPRNNVTYIGNFEVLEHWGGASLEELSATYDFYISESAVDNSANFLVIKNQYFYIYNLNKR